MDGITLNTNLSALTANRAAENTNARLGRLRERLALGLRVEKAADDASGLAVSNRLESSIRVLEQGINNALDGVSITQMTTAALSQYLSILRRIRDLSVRASSETLTDLARQNLQLEVSQLIEQLEKLTRETKFNGLSLLNSGEVKQGAPKVVSLSPVEQITTGGADTLPGFSPDGTKLVFSRGPAGAEDIYIKDIGSGTETQLTAGGGRDRYATFSSDGTKIVFSSDGNPLGTNPEGDREIFTMNIDGSGLTQLTTNAFDDSHPRYSPDGTRIAYATGLFTADAGQDIATIDSTLGDTGGVTQVTASSNFNYQPAYSPDGSAIAYTTDLPPPSTSLHVNTISSTATVGAPAPTTVSHNFLQMEGPVYSPDGSFIYFRSAASDIPPFNYGLYVTNANGTSVSDFTLLFDFSSPADEGRPTISTTTGMLAFSSNTGGPANIYGTTPTIMKTFIVSGNKIEIHIGDQAGQVKQISLTNVDPAKFGLKTLDITTFNGAQKAIADIDAAMNTILSEQAKMGAQENTLEFLSRDSGIRIVEIQTSKSRIVDANMAEEITNLAKGLILQNAQTAIKAQANLLSSSILSLINMTRDSSSLSASRTPP